MHYLQRDARREGIMQAAMRLALRGGFAAMTVRQIAREACGRRAAAPPLHLHRRAESAGFHPPDPRDARHAAGG